jgi:hypothetical protein
MIGRLVKGLILGLIIGGLAAAVLIKGLHVLTFAVAAGGVALMAYAAALATGAVVGLIAGKPIWADGAWIEGLLKTFFGALLAAGGMFLMRKFAGMDLDLSRFDLGSGPAGELAVVTLPAIAMILSVFFEVDNTDSAPPAETKGRVAGKVPGPKAQLRAPKSSAASELDGDDDVAPAKKAKK